MAGIITNGTIVAVKNCSPAPSCTLSSHADLSGADGDFFLDGGVDGDSRA